MSVSHTTTVTKAAGEQQGINLSSDARGQGTNL